MDKTSNRTTDLDLAKLFFEKSKKEKIIADLFDFFEFNCLERCNVNPDDLDNKIKAFENSDYGDLVILAEIIELIKSGKDVSKKQEAALVQNIKNYILQHLTDNITVEEIASNLYISYYYMCHFFKSKTGISVNAFRNQKRIEKACRQLINTDKKIADIATECGFENISYFTEVFNKTVSVTPRAFREKAKTVYVHDFYEYEDILLAAEMPAISFADSEMKKNSNKNVSRTSVYKPDEKLGFLHEAAIIEYHGVLYASWYNCPKQELRGYTPICGKRSYDGGKTWSELEILADDKTERILYCPPVYGIDDDKLYMFVNQMVAPDHIHSLDLYVLNTENENFELCWSKPIPFKLNTNVVALPNGKLMLPGRVGEPDGFPNTPAVLISDSGKIRGDWRLVKIAENGKLIDGKQLVHPEISVICAENILYMFCRNDQSRVPLVYISTDFGESWSTAHSHDIPYVSSKIYCGDLKDGRHYMVCNTNKFNRSKMVVYFTDDATKNFKKELVLFDRTTELWGACHYPAAYEFDDKLYIIATVGYENHTRGADLFIVDLNDI